MERGLCHIEALSIGGVMDTAYRSRRLGEAYSVAAQILASNRISCFTLPLNPHIVSLSSL